MSKATVIKYKWFWDDQDLEKETWLREMARQGLHLKGAANPRWSFVKGEPADVAYRLDYSSKARDCDYNRLLEEAGWECATTTMGWHYWRKHVVDGKAPEIFTDGASKIDRFWRVLALLLLLTLPGLMHLPKTIALLPAPGAAIMVALLALIVYAMIRLLIRIDRLRKAA